MLCCPSAAASSASRTHSETLTPACSAAASMTSLFGPREPHQERLHDAPWSARRRRAQLHRSDRPHAAGHFPSYLRRFSRQIPSFLATILGFLNEMTSGRANATEVRNPKRLHPSRAHGGAWRRFGGRQDPDVGPFERATPPRARRPGGRQLGARRRAHERRLAPYDRQARDALRSRRDVAPQHTRPRPFISDIQVDEIWSYVAKKQARVTAEDGPEVGEAYTFTALATGSRFVPAWLVGKRDQASTDAFVADLRSRLVVMPAMTSDGWAPYITAIGTEFGPGVDYAQTVKNYTKGGRRDDHRYEPPRDPFITKKAIFGAPNIDRASTSYVERNNGTMRHKIGRMRRLVYAFSKDLEHHKVAVALGYVHYNLCHVVRTLRVTPAMAANVVGHAWDLPELLDALMSTPETSAPVTGPLAHLLPAGPARELPGGRGFFGSSDEQGAAAARTEPGARSGGACVASRRDGGRGVGAWAARPLRVEASPGPTTFLRWGRSSTYSSPSGSPYASSFFCMAAASFLCFAAAAWSPAAAAAAASSSAFLIPAARSAMY